MELQEIADGLRFSRMSSLFRLSLCSGLSKLGSLDIGVEGSASTDSFVVTTRLADAKQATNKGCCVKPRVSISSVTDSDSRVHRNLVLK